MRYARRVVAVVSLFLFSLGSAVAVEQPSVDVQVQQLMQARDYAAAVAAIDQALQQEGAPKDYLAYLKGRALTLDKKYDEAAAVLVEIGEQSPDSPWARKGRFAAAAAQVAKGDFGRAEAIYRAEAESLLSLERKQEVAGVYLEFADRLFDPPSESAEPDYAAARELYQKALDYAAARELYQKALDLGLTPEKRLEVELRIARCLQESEQPPTHGGLEGAVAAYTAFLEDHPDSTHELEARFRLGQCRLAQKEFAKARQVWRDLASMHPESDSPRIAEAAFRLAETWQIPEPQSERALVQGVAALRRFVERYPDHELAAKAHLQIARSYVYRAEYEHAVEALATLLDDPRYEKSEEIAEARNLLGLAYRQQEKYDEAIAAWKEFLAEHPAHPAWSAVQKEIVDTEYRRALTAYEAERYDEAATRWNAFLARHPLDARSAHILFLLGGIEAKREQWEAAVATWRRVASKHPESAEARRARLAVAATLEEKLGRMEEALDEYRKLAELQSYEQEVAQARGAIVRMTSPTLTLTTERVYRSTEKPAVRLSTRNVKSVSVRVYRVDLEAYFRKMHTTDRVGALDIALIDPDATFLYEVPEYAKYREFDNTIEVPIPEGQTAGVLAVTVSSETQEATTLVLQSDLDMIVKSSRDEVFVFAENMLTGKPWPGARLLLSDGSRVFAEVATDEHGVFRGAPDELEKAVDLQVFATAEESVATHGLDLAAVEPAAELSGKGYLATDRPVYRPGQQVRVRGVLRHVEDGAFHFEPGGAYTLEVYDPRDRRLWREPVALGDLGSFHTRFPLPEVCASGDYLLRVEDGRGHRFSRQFRVEPLRKQPVRVEIDVPRTVFYQGETIEGTIRATTSYGVPLAGREVRYQLADELEQTATTDGRGEVHFRLSTDEFCATQMLTLSARLTGGPGAASTMLHLSAEGFTVGLQTTRSVYMAGETFRVDLATRDAHAQPVGRKLTLSVFKRAETGDREELVEEYEIESDAAGEAVQPLTLDAGGDYVLRAKATDRFGNAIVVQRSVWISDESDETRLWVLADATRLKPGDAAVATLLWHEAPALALVTCEGETVLDYRLVPLQTGANRVEIPVEAELAPNFQLAVAVMTDVREKSKHADAHFFMAAEAFQVRRELEVDLAVARPDGATGPFRPGESLEVTVTTADPQGRAVPAAVGLALVDARFDIGAMQPGPGEFFRKPRRRAALRTGASVAFEYRPATKPISFWLADEGGDSEVEEEETPREVLQWRNHREQAPESLEAILDGTARQPEYPQGQGMPQFGFGPENDNPFADAPNGGDPFADAPNGDDPFGDAPNGDDPFGAAETAQEVQTVPPRAPNRPTGETDFASTGYWNPAVRTGEDGRATVTVVLPARLAAWQLRAEAVAVGTLAGDTELNITAAKDLHVELHLPEAFTEGDMARIPVAVHNDAIDEGAVVLRLKTTILGQTTEARQTVEVEGKGRLDVGFPVTLGLPEGVAVAAPWLEAAFELTVTAGERTDVVRRSVPVLPLGVPTYATASGMATGSKAVRAGLPAEAAADRRSMRLLVSPSLERALLDSVLDQQASQAVSRPFRPIPSPLERATVELMGAVALRKLVKPEDNPSDAEALDRLIATAVARLVAAQDDAGNWTWTGAEGKADLLSTARATWALSLAKAADYPVPEKTLHDARGALRDGIADSEEADYDCKAILLHAMTVAGESDFSLANRLHRDRTQLSPAALAYLALTLAEMNRADTAAEVLGLLAEKDLDKEASGPDDSGKPPRRRLSPVELRAVFLLGLQKADPQSPQIEALVDWLLAQRSSARWQCGGAAGPAVAALARWRTKHGAQPEPFTMAVSVNGRELKRLELAADGATEVVDVPGEMLVGESSEIRFLTDAKAGYAWQCLLEGYVPLDNPKAAGGAKIVHKTSQPAPRMLEGRELPRGFGVLTGSYERFINPLSQLPVERRAVVELRFRRLTPAEPSRSRPDYAVITDPIPAGTRVIEQSIAGPVERFEITPAGVTFHVVHTERIGEIHYELVAEAEGTYRTGPTLMRPSQHPGSLVSSGESFTLEILPGGAESADPYRFTPEELYALGRHYFDKQQHRQAEKHLRELIDQWNVDSQVYHNAVEMLLDVYLEIGPAAKVVDTFEIIRTKWPDMQITFDQLLKIGAAYEAMDEWERSYLVYRAAVEGNLTREGAVAGFLEMEDELLRSIDFMERLLREYPPEDYVASALYSLAQHVRAEASEAGDDPKLRQAGVDGDALVRRSIAMFERFLTEYPENENADRAAFSVANALLEREQYEEAIAACSRYAERYPQSKLVDSYWYILGYCRFALGQPDAAADMFGKVARYEWTDPETGRTQPSTNKWPAIFLLGQTFHSQGEPAAAIEQYRRVEDRFAEARRSIAYFLRQQIALPELTTLKPGEAAEVKLTYRNLPSCDVKIYAIDLLKFGRLRRSLGGADQVNLAGIRPRHEEAVKLESGLDVTVRTHPLTLPLEETGAYLLVCRGGNDYASGLVLVTPIETKVEHIESEEAARVMVRDAAADRVVSGAQVNVIDSATGRSVSGKTDLRGVFVAEGIAGPPTVIVKDAPSRYSLHQAPRAAAPGRRAQMAEVQIAPPGEAAGARFGVPLGRDENARIRKALAASVALQFVEMPLRDVVDYLRNAAKIEIQVDRKSLDDVGLATDMPITIDLRNVSLRSALRLMLRDLGLTYTIADEVLLITTPEEAENRMETRMYRVSDLVRFQDKEGAAWSDVDSLIELITSTVEPQTWDEVGGPGSITPMAVRGEDVIVLSQTHQVHEKIDKLIGRLHEVGDPPADGELPVRERPQWGEQGMGGFGGLGGMGGFGGGMGGGFGGGGAAPDFDPAVPMPAPQPGGSGKAELLRGLNEAQRAFQGEEADQLQQMYQKGKGAGGVGAGGVF